MRQQLEQYIGRTKACELLELDTVKTKPQVRREIFLTAARHALLRAAEAERLPNGLNGGMGMSGLYSIGHTGRWRVAGNLDIHIPQDVSEEKIARVFEKAGLEPDELINELNKLFPNNNTHRTLNHSKPKAE